MKKLPLLVAAGLVATASAASARDYIEIVGSSTVYPFTTVVAETFGNKTKFKTPKIESTGTGGGMKLFCSGTGIDTPDITNASRRMKSSEFEDCQKNGVKDIVEVQVGFDGIAIANSKEADQMELTRKDLFLALAKSVPGKTPGELIPNPYQTWQDVNPALPATKIEVLGPPPTSGTRDAFAELAMEGGCKAIPEIAALKKTNGSLYKEVCHSVREDGAYIEAGENDNLIVQKLEKNPKALGVFGFSFLDQNADKVQGSKIDGVELSFDSIADGNYPVSRPLYFYVKSSHVGKIPGIKEFLAEFVTEDAFGEEGYLTEKGLIPMPEENRKSFRQAATELKSLSL
ncbi:PstS family phosphate ABC transporter substrate-binding protein [Leucothrix mucor]|uniref:PstS family phosphate ABC transporter substrate-binding protein n=1 Tax=Leucothrix mucor TaxID=45248 RepID=UPI0003B327EE|nr:PstS family phosphate ABC transporter substrate-binding protein [Leucothrix mucor]